jgi:nucleotide-binding universal stress UspA family protein
MNTRGLIELVVLNIGLDLGVISPTLFTMMVLMALVTTFMTSPLLEWIYPLSEISKELIDAPDAEATPLASKPGFVVLMCVSYQGTGPAMVTVGGALVGAGADRGRLYALRLIPPADRASFVLHQQSESVDASVLAPLLDRAKTLDQEVRPLSFVSAQPSKDICSVAEVKRAGIVLLGWHKPLLGNTVLSGTVHEVMRRARTDVGVLIDRGLDRITRVLVPFLGSVHDRAALRLSRRIAQNTGASVTILHVVRPGKQRIGVEEKVDEVFAEPTANGGSRVDFRTVLSADPGAAVLDECQSRYDLVIIGVGPEWGLEHRPFGLQSELLIKQCPASLLVVRQYAPMAEQALASDRAPPAHRASLATHP